MVEMEFVHLHVHSDGSLLDSTATTEGLLGGAREMKMKFLALTDTNSLRRAEEFFKLASSFGINPILGIELSYYRQAFLTTPYQMIFLIENEKGFHNLLQILNSAHLDRPLGFPPQAAIEDILNHSEGLFALAGNLQSESSFLLQAEKADQAFQVLEELKEAFRDRFYLELSWHGEPEEKLLIRHLLSWSQRLRAPMVATNDAHYLKPKDQTLYEILTSIRTLSRWKEPHQEKKRLRHRHLCSSLEMKKIYSFCPQALRQSLELAERTCFSFPQPHLQLPNSGLSEKEEMSKLREICFARLAFYYTKPEKARSRLLHELEMIEKMGYAGYFLLVFDLVEEAKKRGISVFGRGSAASSIISYLLGITLVDPIRENLLFERFLNPARINDPPDIDLDISQGKRKELMNYVREKYGSERIVHVGAFSTFRLRGATREVGKVLGKSKEEIDQWQEALQFGGPASEEGKKWLELSRRLVGLLHSVSTHPSGFVISCGSAREELPLQYTPEGIVTQWDMYSLARLGFLKMDFLGSRNLEIIENALAQCDDRLKREGIPTDDRETWEMIARGETIGCFQLESSGMRNLLRQLQPKNLSDLTVALSLYRPGPIQGGMVQAYIRRHHGNEEVTYPHPTLRDVLEETHGVILYQEQVMQIAQTAAGFSLAEADILRKAMSDKDRSSIVSLRERFLHGAKERGITEKAAQEVFSLLEKFAGYGFNKAHSASYAIIAYRTAYLKRHRPLPFLATLLSTQMGYYPPFVYAEEARLLGIRLLAPEINRSEAHCTVEGDAVRLGLVFVKGLGPRQIEEILAKRPGGGFQNLEELCSNLKTIDRRTLEALIQAGGMDSWALSRATLLATLPLALRRARQRTSLFLANEGQLIDCELHSLSQGEEMELAWQSTGLYTTAHPLELFRSSLRPYEVDASRKISSSRPGSRFLAAAILVFSRLERTKSGDRMGFLSLEDLAGQWEAILFPPELGRFAPLLRPRSLLLLEGEVNEHQRERNFIVKDLRPWKESAAGSSI